MSARAALLLLGALGTTACFESNRRDEAGEAGIHDADVLADADVLDGGQPTTDSGMCEPLGSTRLCGDLCGLACPAQTPYCSEFWNVCVNNDRDQPRGIEECSVDLRYGRPYCYTGRLCATSARAMPTESSWGGTCVSEEYCRWVEEQPGLEDVRCRYTDGFEFQDGPPDHACAEGALAENPFCGGRCRDQCVAYPGGATVTRQGACVGRSETRGFGVCTYSSMRCSPAGTAGEDPFAECQFALDLAGVPDPTCVCMMLSPVLMDEYADHGWAVSEQTCLAYQARYPDEVRCVPESEL